MELNAAEWHAASVEKGPPVEKVAENATAGRWPSGEERWRATALECGGARGRQPVGRGGERRGGMVALEHTLSGAVNGEEQTTGS